MKNLVAVLLVAFLLAAGYLTLRAHVAETAVAEEEQQISGFLHQSESQPANSVVMLEREIEITRAALRADERHWRVQIKTLSERYKKAKREMEESENALWRVHQEASAQLEKRRDFLADLERKFHATRDRQAPKSVDVYPTLSSENKLDLMLKRLDSIEQRLQKLEGKPSPQPLDR
jgi:hypothetical protein